MSRVAVAVLLLGVAFAAGLPTDWVIQKLDDGPRFQYAEGAGKSHLVDTWMSVEDAAVATRFEPDRQIVYHLFTRSNPTVSSPLLPGNEGLLGQTNFDPRRRTIILIHGWLDSATAEFNTVLVPSFLSNENVNVIVVDWGAGAGTINYAAAVTNTRTAGESVARFVNWLHETTGTTGASYHIVGHSLGAHQAGIIGRNVNRSIAYITALDPAFPGFITNDHKFRSTDAVYTEVIHTNAGLLGYLGTLGDVDFYPNGGINMPGCNSQDCDHSRSYFYLAESVTTGGFTGTRCATFVGAMSGNCWLWGSLRMGGLVPKTGSSGIYYLETNAGPPFSRG